MYGAFSEFPLNVTVLDDSSLYEYKIQKMLEKEKTEPPSVTKNETGRPKYQHCCCFLRNPGRCFNTVELSGSKY